MDVILSTIDEALARKRLSDAAASKLAVGHPSLIKNLRMPRDGEKRYNLPSLQKLADVLDLEFYFGPRRETAPIPQVTLEGVDYASIPLHEAWLSAGPGIANAGANIVDHLAFRRDWLARIGVTASQLCLARVTGDSMFPTLSPGDMVLLDTSKTAPPVRPRTSTDKRRPAIWALVDNGEARIKRIERPTDSTMLLLSDNQTIRPNCCQVISWQTFKSLGKWSGGAIQVRSSCCARMDHQAIGWKNTNL